MYLSLIKLKREFGDSDILLLLSKDSTLSCGSCHKQDKAFSDSPKTFSSGINGSLMKRNTMPLFNLPWYSNFFWDGKVNTIEEQVFHPVRSHDEMDLDWKEAAQRIKENSFYLPKFYAAFGNQEIDSITISKAIAQFERTLISYNSKYDQVLRGDAYFTTQEYEGFVLINDQVKGNCLHCHTTDANALGTTTGFSNNGLDNFTTPQEFRDKGKGNVTNKHSDIGLFKNSFFEKCGRNSSIHARWKISIIRRSFRFLYSWCK